jgi:threonine dehydrogenase-like Zn-dependent dehydrogenase
VGTAGRAEIDPTLLLTHDMTLEESPKGYELFEEKKDNCVRAVFRP